MVLAVCALIFTWLLPYRLDRASRKVKSLERIIFELGYSTNTTSADSRRRATSSALGITPSASINYLDVAARPSIFPARPLCAVCGASGLYKCTRCGSRFCSKRCNAHHKETTCMKFSMWSLHYDSDMFALIVMQMAWRRYQAFNHIFPNINSLLESLTGGSFGRLVTILWWKCIHQWNSFIK